VIGRKTPVRSVRRGVLAAPALLVLLAAAPWSDVLAQDALRGKRLFLDVGRTSGAGVSCVDCHGGLPGGNFGIDRAANEPRIIENAVNTIPQMARLRGRLAAADFADLAAYIGNPAVPSPDLRLTTSTTPNGADRIDFGTAAPGGAPATATLNVVNAGQVPMQLASAPLIATGASDFRVSFSDCVAGMQLAAQQSCRVDLSFAPVAAGLRSAALRFDHDWVGGTAAAALIGTGASAPAETPPATLPPVAVTEQGGGGAIDFALLGLLALLAEHRRRRRQR
jgi:mono/diheme cytochrome c family protein